MMFDVLRFELKILRKFEALSRNFIRIIVICRMPSLFSMKILPIFISFGAFPSDRKFRGSQVDTSFVGGVDLFRFAFNCRFLMKGRLDTFFAMISGL